MKQTRMRLCSMLLISVAAALLALLSGTSVVSGGPAAAGISCDCNQYEFNDDFQAAAVVSTDEVIQTYLCSETDADYFMFLVLRGQTIDLELRDMPADYDLELFDPRDSIVESSYNTDRDPELIQHTAEKSGYYRVLVYSTGGYHDDGQPYSLEIELGPEPFRPMRYVAASGSDDGNDCTDSSSPCGTIQHAIDLADAGDEVRVAAGTYRAAATSVWEVALITKSLSLRGGYELGDWQNAYPLTTTTILDGQDIVRGVSISLTDSLDVILEGLHIAEGYQDGLGQSGPSSGHGGGIYAYGATGLIRGCRVYSGTASEWGGQGGGLALQECDVAMVDTAMISNTSEYGAGGFWISGGRSVLDNCVVTDNSGVSSGGGALVSDATTLLRNRIVGNRSRGVGGLLLDHSQALIRKNLIARNAGLEVAAGIAVDESDARVFANTVIRNAQTFAHWGRGGIRVADSTVSLANNVIAGNTTGTQGAGIHIQSSDVVMAHNTIAGNSGGNGAAVHVALLSGAPSTVVMSNTIISSHEIGVYADSGNTVSLAGTLWYANLSNLSGSGAIAHVNDVAGMPAFVDAGAGDYHIGSASAAIDRGIDAGIPADFEGDCRPQGSAPDLGADEYPAEAVEHIGYLPMVLKGM